MLSDKQGGVWIGTRGEGLRRLQASKLRAWGLSEGLGNQNVRSLLQATNGDLWVGTESPSRLRLLKGDEFFDLKIPADVRSIRALVEDVHGAIWAGTSDGYILRVSGTNAVNEVGAQDADEARAFSVRCLQATPDGSLWIGYAGWGVGRWHNGRYARVSTAQGLHDDYVSELSGALERVAGGDLAVRVAPDGAPEMRSLAESFNRMTVGPAEARYELSDLRVTDLKLETGASETELTLPARAGFTRVRIKSGEAAGIENAKDLWTPAGGYPERSRRAGVTA